MANVVRPRRSVLYMPGSNARALEKARSLSADAYIFDLEDSVTADAKVAARAQACQAAAGGGFGAREIVIRANGLETPWGADDLAAIARSGAHAALIPKVDDADKVNRAAEILDENGAPAELALWCMMETPLGILRAEQIAQVGRRAAVWVMGTNDLAKDLRAAHTPERQPMLASLGLCLLAARAYGIDILDGVHNDLADQDGLVAACRQGRALGFDGKTLIHPSQIAPCNEAFSPGLEEIAAAREIIAAFAEARAAGSGVVTVGGRMVEALHVEQAERLVALADAIAALDRAH